MTFERICLFRITVNPTRIRFAITCKPPLKKGMIPTMSNQNFIKFDTGAATKYNQVNLVTRNPNGSMTAVLVNNEKTEQVFKLVMGDQVMEVPIAGRSVITVTWDANA